MSKKRKVSGFRLLLHALKRVIRRDEKYIEKVSRFDVDADYIEIHHNGNKDYGKVLYVIKENTGYDGFCATVRFAIFFLIYAKEHGFVPVIRFTKEFAYFDEEKSREIKNPWEYYFVSADDAYDVENALNVCYGDYIHRDYIRSRYDFSPYKAENYFDESIFEVCSPLIKEYLRLKPEIIADASGLLGGVREKGQKILGVHFRGTDYKQGFNNHPIFVGEEETIEEIKKVIGPGMFEAVFLATDDASMGEKIKSALPGTMVLMHTDVFRSDGDESVAFSENGRKYHHYLLGYEVARDMYTLSLCDGLVAGKSSVGFLSNLYKHSRDEEYEYLHIIDHGNNVNDKECYQ